MKKFKPSNLIRPNLLLIIPMLSSINAPEATAAQIAGDDAGFSQKPARVSSQAPAPSPDSPQAGSNTGIPALNIISAPARPPLPPPPETPPPQQAAVMQAGALPSLPQAWRVKALQLFKANSALDKSSVFGLRLQATYANAFEAFARALSNSGITVEALSFSSGHILLSCPNENGLSDKAIIALRQSAPGSDSSASSGTDVRIFCDSRNHALTQGQIKGILMQVDTSLAGSQNKTGAESL